MENTQKRTGLLILAAYIGVFAGIMALGIVFRGRSLADHRTEETSYIIREEILRFNALEWQAIANLPNDMELMADIDYQRTVLTEALDSMVQHDPGSEKLQLLQQTYANYKQATFEEFGLLISGRTEEALAVDEKRTDPLLQQLDSQAAEITEIYSNQAHRQSDLSYLAISIAIFSSLLFTGSLAWIYHRSLQKHRQTSMEKAALAMSEERFRSVAQSAMEAIITIGGGG